MTSILFLTERILIEWIQMQLSKKQKTYSDIFLHFSEFRLNIKHYEKNMGFITYIFWKLQTAKDVVTQMSKKSRFRRFFN